MGSRIKNASSKNSDFMFFAVPAILSNLALFHIPFLERVVLKELGRTHIT
ncbi:MAG: hypothetical protein QXS04_00630 [Thermoproteota archaeon]